MSDRERLLAALDSCGHDEPGSILPELLQALDQAQVFNDDQLANALQAALWRLLPINARS